MTIRFPLYLNKVAQNPVKQAETVSVRLGSNIIMIAHILPSRPSIISIYRVHSFGNTPAQRIVKELGYNRQQNRKMEQVGEASLDRDEQFEFIRSQRDEAIKEGAPVISVDTKKKENLGNFKNGGTEYRPSGSPRRVSDHDFFIPELGKVTPYGVYVLNHNTAFVNLGTSADTGVFSAESVRRWWYAVGRENFGYAKRIVITADCGGSNGYRNRLWKLSLAALADEIGKEIEVLHYPPGTSKYNKVEHRLFCYIFGD